MEKTRKIKVKKNNQESDKFEIATFRLVRKTKVKKFSYTASTHFSNLRLLGRATIKKSFPLIFC